MVGQASAIPKIGFVHSGYTASDPDGKSAMLTVTLQFSKGMISSKEKDVLTQEGALSFAPRYSALPAEEITVDVSLPDDQAEESRVRAQLGFPKKIPSSNATLPIQILWKEVSGKTLYKWLTAAIGLSFKVHYNSTVSGDLNLTPLLSPETLQAWWTMRNGASEVMRSQEGPIPVALDILSSNSMLSGAASLLLLTNQDALLLSRVVQVINSVSTVQPDHAIVLTRSTFLAANWSQSGDSSIRLPMSPSTFDQPTALLVAHPELVKDLSGSGVGVGALLQDGN